MPSSRTRLLTVALAVFVVAGLGVGLSACTGSGSKSSSGLSAGSVGGAQTDAKPADARQAAGAPAAGPSATSAPTTPAPAIPLQQRAIVRTGSVKIQASNVDAAANQIVTKAAQLGGRVDGDDRLNSGSSRTANLVLRVPPNALDGLIADVIGQGKELSRSIKGEDVTAAKADVKARVEALTTSVGRLRDFLRHSGSIKDLISLESDLSQREAELESTVAQQNALNDQISLATLTVAVVGPPTAAPPKTTANHDPSGFGAALAGGWHAITVAFRWSAAGVGYALPFVVLVALLGATAWFGYRRIHPRNVVQTASEPV